MKILVLVDKGWFKYRTQLYIKDSLVYEIQSHNILSAIDDIKNYLIIKNINV